MSNINQNKICYKYQYKYKFGHLNLPIVKFESPRHVLVVHKMHLMATKIKELDDQYFTSTSNWGFESSNLVKFMNSHILGEGHSQILEVIML